MFGFSYNVKSIADTEKDNSSCGFKRCQTCHESTMRGFGTMQEHSLQAGIGVGYLLSDDFMRVVQLG